MSDKTTAGQSVPPNVLLEIRRLVDKQAEDDGLWFDAMTCPEAYLQQALRRLHALIDKYTPK